MELIKGEAVTVIRPTVTYDELHEPEFGEPVETGATVLVCPGSTADLDATRPNGVEVAYTLHFPKTWTESLRGCSVRVRGEVLAVVGDPRAYTAANTPGAYNMPVEVTRTDG